MDVAYDIIGRVLRPVLNSTLLTASSFWHFWDFSCRDCVLDIASAEYRGPRDNLGYLGHPFTFIRS